jgi:hypothetical protein
MIDTRGASFQAAMRGRARGTSPVPATTLAWMSPITEITVLGGERFRVEGGVKEVERLVLDAARGSLMELAWLTDLGTGELIGVNPESVVMLRAVGSAD